LKRVIWTAYRLAALAAVAFVVYRVNRPAPRPADESIAIAGVAKLFPGAGRVVVPRRENGWSDVLDAEGKLLGRVVSTSPAADRKVAGFAGPTPALVGIGPDGRIIGLFLLANDESPDYLEIAVDGGMLERWNGLDWREAGAAKADTVSGATMSNAAIRDSVRLRLALAVKAEGAEGDLPSPRPAAGLRFSWPDGVTLALLVTALALFFTSSRHHKKLRIAQHLAVVAWMGFYVGTFVSQAKLFGWAANGAVLWRREPAMVLLAVVSMAIPVATGRPLYCAYLCPHGAAQELIGRISPWSRRLPKGLAKWLGRLPGLLLLVMAGLVLFGMSAKYLASFEPFGGYGAPTMMASVGLALGVGTCVVLGLVAAGWVASIFLKRPWCRFGCATGALLRFLQGPRKEVKLGAVELAAGAAIILAAAAWLLGR